MPVNYIDIPCDTGVCLGFQASTMLPNCSCWLDFSTFSSFPTFFGLYVCVATLEIFYYISGLGLMRESRQVMDGILIIC